VKIEVPQSEFVTLQPKKSNLDFQCQCKELSITTNESLCSDYASTRGNDQKVISISYFNQEVEKLRKIVEDTYAFYPGYFLRIYHNLTEKQVGYNSVKKWKNCGICDFTTQEIERSERNALFKASEASLENRSNQVSSSTAVQQR
jgi:hypothetical protein